MSLPNNIVQTSNLGLYLINTGQPGSPDNNADLTAAINFNASVVDGRSGIAYAEQTSPASAIPLNQGVVGLGHAGGTAAYTLTAPIAGLPSAAGNDGQELTLINTSTTSSITIATPAAVIQGLHSLMTITLGGAVVIRALGGFWYVVGSQGLTISA